MSTQMDASASIGMKVAAGHQFVDKAKKNSNARLTPKPPETLYKAAPEDLSEAKKEEEEEADYDFDGTAVADGQDDVFDQESWTIKKPEGADTVNYNIREKPKCPDRLQCYSRVGEVNYDIPQWAGQGNCMLATWTLGRHADPQAVLEKLKHTPFECTVILYSRMMKDTDEIAKWIEAVADLDQERIIRSRSKRLDEFVAAVAIHRIWPGCFVVINRIKVTCLQRQYWTDGEDPLQSQDGDRSINRSSGIQLATVELRLNERRQNMKAIKLGVVRVLQKKITYWMELALRQMHI